MRNLIDLDPAAVGRVIMDQAADLQAPARFVEDVVDALEEAGLAESAPELRRLLNLRGAS